MQVQVNMYLPPPTVPSPYFIQEIPAAVPA